MLLPRLQDLKEKVLNNIRQQESPVKEAKVITMETRPRSSSWLRYVAALLLFFYWPALILLMICIQKIRN